MVFHERTHVNGLVRGLVSATNRNAPAILAAIGVAGTVLTAVAAVAGDRQAALRCENAGIDAPTNRDRFEHGWRCYIPAVMAGAGTVSAIFAGYRIGAVRSAAAVAACTMTSEAFDRYRSAAKEVLPEDQRKKVESASAAKIRLPENRQNVIFVEGGTVLCYDGHSGRYFRSSMNHLRKVQNDLNRILISESSVSLNEFYEHVGLPTTAMGDQLGWRVGAEIELHFSTSMGDNEEPCLVVDFITEPIPDWFKLG